MKAAAEESKSPPTTIATTPETQSLLEQDAEDQPAESSNGDSDTLQASSISVNTEDPKTKEKADEKPSDKADSNLVGKINNLVSTDLENIVEARDFFLLVFYVPVQMALCIVFLYMILGWR